MNNLTARQKEDLAKVIDKGLTKFFSFVATFVIAFFLITAVLQYVPIAKDSTDPNWGRSGLTIMTDNLTGCEYLSTRNGGLIERNDAEGNQICNK